MLNIWSVKRTRIRTYAELFDQRRVCATNNQCRNNCDHNTNRWKAPRSPECGHKEQCSNSDGNSSQNRVRGKRCIDIRIHCAVNIVTALCKQRVPADPVLHPNNHRGNRSQNSQVTTHRNSRVRTRYRLQTAVEVRGNDRNDQRKNHQVKQEGNNKLQEGKGKNEEGNIPAKNRICLPKRRRIKPRESCLPSFCKTKTCGDTQNQCDQPEGKLLEWLNSILVLPQIRGGFAAL